ncbi:MAG: phospholipase D-like domain-containing protein [Mycoplasma sp.]
MIIFKKFAAWMTLLGILVCLALMILLSIYASTEWWWMIIIFAICYVINIGFCVFVFYSDKRNNLEKKAWMFVLIMFPFIGPIIFLKYGFYPFHKKQYFKSLRTMINLNILEKKYSRKEPKTNYIFEQLSAYSNQLTKSKHNSAEIQNITNVSETYRLTVDYIRSAKKCIFLNYYILSDGIWLKTIINELVKQARKGVKIYFMYDFFGAKKRIPKKLISNLESENIIVSKFRPKKLFYVSGYDNSRSHKKILIIDNEKCIYGGFNIADEYINYSSKYQYWYDEAFTIKGNIIKEYIKSFASDWMTYSSMSKNNELINTIKDFKLLDKNFKQSNAEIQIFDSNPEIIDSHMINFLMLMMSKAQKRIWINTPYLYPTEYLMNVLISLSKLGIDIRIVVPGIPDNKKFSLVINRSQYHKLLTAGIKVYETEAFNHSKSIIVDDKISLIGSCNLDPRAMNLNFENSSLVYSKEINESISKRFESNFIKSNQKLLNNKKHLSRIDSFLVKLLLILEPIF